MADGCSIIFSFTKSYTPLSGCNDLTFRHGVSEDHEVYTFPAVIEMDSPLFLVDNRDTIDITTGTMEVFGSFSVIEEYPNIITQPGILDCLSQIVSIGGNNPEDLPCAIGGSWGDRWGNCPVAHNIDHKSSFENCIPTDVEYSDRWDKLTEYSIAITEKYKSCIPTDIEILNSWNSCRYWSERKIRTPWKIPGENDKEGTIKWGGRVSVDKKVSTSYLLPGEKDSKKIIAWGGFSPVFADKKLNWLIPTPKDKTHITRWGDYWYSLWCEKKYRPSNCGKVAFSHYEDAQIGICSDINILHYPPFNAICPDQEHKHSGVRDKYIPIIYDPVFYPDISEVYYMLNTCLIKRLPDNTEIDSFSVDLQIDKDSTLWDFSIVLPSKTYVDLIKPEVVDGEPVYKDIEININGWKWTCRIDKWSETRTFGQQSWTLTGRSLSCEIADDMSLPLSYTNSVAAHGGEIISDLLSGTGWEIEWGPDNNSSTYSDYFNPTSQWMIPAGSLSFTNMSALSAIKKIVGDIGGVVQTKAYCYGIDKKLIVSPRYPKNPWSWDTLTIPASLLDAHCVSMGQEFISNKSVNSVIVRGDHDGALVNATLNGSDGLSPAPMFVSPLITTEQAGAEKARNIIANSGVWSRHTVRSFSLRQFGTASTSTSDLVLPGTMLTVTEDGEQWIGNTIATSVRAESGDQGINVEQTLIIEEYLS